MTRADASQAQGKPSDDPARPAAIIVGRYVAPDGSLQPETAIMISKGRIAVLRTPPEEVESQDAARFPHAVACPGLIDLRSSIGASGNLTEQAFAIDPQASAIDSLNRRHRDFQAALRAGITTVALLPAEDNLVCGAAAVVKTAAVADDGVIRRDGPLVFSLSSRVWQYDRAPTSRIGSLAMLRDALEKAGTGEGDQRLRDFVGGTLDGLIFCDTPMDVSAALRTFAA